jgi:outer membrane lipoprotein-sorting protein
MNSRRYELSTRVGLALLAFSTLSAARVDLRSPPLSAEAIVQKLMAANAQRAQALRGYRGKRVYHLDYKGLFGNHQAEMTVEAVYTAPDKKEFRILSESGSRLLINRVLLKLLSSESEAQEEQNRKALEISPANYDFSLDQIEHTSDGDFYVLNVKPKNKSRFLYNGKIWVDTHDFAVVRMQGVPQKNPSIWTSHTEIEYRWADKDGFWLPVRNQSLTQVRMGGKCVLTIDYSDYRITGVNRASMAQRPGQSQTMPDPASVTADPH